MPEQPALFTRSAATETLAAMLVGCAEGATVTYEDMRRATNRDVQRADRHLLAQARRIALKAGAAFSPVVRVGLQRLEPAQFALEGGRIVKRLGRTAKRGGKLLDAANLASLSPDDQLRHAAVCGVLAAVESSAAVPPSAPGPQGSRDPVVRVS